MRLLAEKGVTTNGECRSLMRRSEHYQIVDLAVPLPTAMSSKDFGCGEFMLISHPGWRRCSCDPESREKLIEFYNAFVDRAAEVRLFKGLSDGDSSFLKSQIMKMFFITQRPRYFYEELQFETALDFAMERNMPVVLTVPCSEEFFGSQYRYRLRDNFAGGYADYIHERVRGVPSVYAIPTKETCGVVIDEQGTTWKIIDKKLSWEGDVYFENGKVSSQLFGRLLNHEWEKIYVAGGAIGYCLQGTLGYFVKNSGKIVLLDDFCHPNDKSTIEFDEELREFVGLSSRFLSRKRDEKRTRQILFKMLRGLEGGTKKIKEYRIVAHLFKLDSKRSKKIGDELQIGSVFNGAGPGESYFSPFVASESGEVLIPNSDITRTG